MSAATGYAPLAGAAAFFLPLWMERPWLPGSPF